MDHKETELMLRVSNLIKENLELKNKVKELSDENEKATREIERLNSIVSSIPKDVLINASSNSLKSNQIRYNMVTVLYIDIRGFKKLSEAFNSEETLDELDEIFINFNKIAKKHNLNIVKTVGDAYLCVGGIPNKNITNPIDVVLASLEMRDYLLRKKKEHQNKCNNIFWEARMGIHTGQVIANPTSRKNFDVKGETVNIAVRLASASDDLKINASVYTYELVKEFFIIDNNGCLPVKYQGDMQMFYIRRIKRAYSVDPNYGAFPNPIFKTKYLLRQFMDLQEFVLDKLERELPHYIHYHNYKHTIDVVNQVELIGYGEGVDDEAILLLKTAGLFHDIGHIISYENHEYLSTCIAKQILASWHYTQEHIEKICKIIMATKLPPNPQTILEKIICDADLDYLGRPDFIPISNSLYLELKDMGKEIDIDTWNHQQVKFLTSHQYFTKTAINLREVGKEKQIERIKSLLK